MKKLIFALSFSAFLTGCATVIEPPESSYNGLYLQIYKVNGPFKMQAEFKEQADCAFAAVNAHALSFGLSERLHAFCTKTPSKLANIKSWVTLNSVKTAFSLSFESIADCTKFMEEGLRTSAITVHRSCYKSD